ncbi:NADPH:quinone oxidoreductase family protein [Streptomyces sp. NPDC005708]|uniref:NADPH:quinone oxidoreductase family protein n=1 Tax=Streptomyces sp. NPDC005708 TaxID=3154564 RepID=UPI0033D339D1
MKAIRIEALEGPGALIYGDVPEPEHDPAQLTIEVHASQVVFPDLLLTQGKYQMRPELPFVLGGVAGGIVQYAPPGSEFEVGDRVTAITLTGGWAETAVANPMWTFKIPDERTIEEGTAVPANYTTMYFALVRRGRLKVGETVLVHGAAGGIGTASVQIASALGARVIAVVSDPAKYDFVRAAGADEVIPAEGFKDAARELTHGRGVDVVVDPVGGDRFTDSLRSLAPEGRLLVIGFAAGDIPTVKVNRLLLNNLDVVGVGWGAFWTPRPTFFRDSWCELSAYLSDGRLTPILGATYPLEQAADALQVMAERRAVGNLMLKVR